MPRYDYACAACGRRFEVVHGITEDAGHIALELNVTEKIMRTWMRLHRTGRLSSR